MHCGLVDPTRIQRLHEQALDIPPFYLVVLAKDKALRAFLKLRQSFSEKNKIKRTVLSSKRKTNGREKKKQVCELHNFHLSLNLSLSLYNQLRSATIKIHCLVTLRAKRRGYRFYATCNDVFLFQRLLQFLNTELSVPITEIQLQNRTNNISLTMRC